MNPNDLASAPRQHTPGPWVAYEDPMANNPSTTWGVNGFHPVAGFAIPQDCQLATVYDVEANARLIAAAPELLAALRLYVEPCTAEECCRRDAIAIAAIARATGA